MSASRAAYIGGCAGTSNVLAGKLFDIPVRGTHAHSWVMSFDTEREAFEAYARAMPNNCVFLVDTYNTMEGVRHAIEVGRWLREQGQALIGIRLDSGDLAYLSIEARKALDEAGFHDCVIYASNDLDELIIESLKKQGAAIAAWGVGTKLVTGHADGALGGVYKISAVRDDEGHWLDRIKLSEQAAKISTPGLLQTRRFRDGDRFVADAVYDERQLPSGAWTIVDPIDPTRRRKLDGALHSQDLLEPFFAEGARAKLGTLEDARAMLRAGLDALHPGIRRFTYPHSYPVGLERDLHDRRTRLILQARGAEL